MISDLAYPVTLSHWIICRRLGNHLKGNCL